MATIIRSQGMRPGARTNAARVLSQEKQVYEFLLQPPLKSMTELQYLDLFYKHDIYRVCLSLCIKHICEICCFVILLPAWLEMPLLICMERSLQAPGDHIWSLGMRPGARTYAASALSREKPGYEFLLQSPLESVNTLQYLDLFYKYDIYRICLNFCIKHICEICCFAILFPACLERVLPSCMERRR